MFSSPKDRLRSIAWGVTCLLPAAAWLFADYTQPYFHLPAGVFFIGAAVISAAIGGLTVGGVGALLNVGGIYLFSSLHGNSSRTSDQLWSLLLVAVTLMIGYARGKWSAAENLAGRLSGDLARLRDELESQRTDLRRFHDLSMRLSSSLELQRLLNDVLVSIAALQKTDLALLLVLPERSSKLLKAEAFAGFTAEQVKLFGEFPASFFSPDRRFTIEDIERPGSYFPFADAAKQIGFRGLSTMPILNARSEPLGVVVTFFRDTHIPSDRQSRLVELYARQAANALDNARIYHDTLETLAAEQRRSAVLRSLAEASVQINSALALDALLQVITDQARTIIGARQAFTTLLPRGAWNQSLSCISVAEGQSVFEFPQQSSEMFMLACNLNKPVRLGGAKSAPWRSVMRPGGATRHGWLAAPLLTRDGRNLGLIQLAEKVNGEFSDDDEAILVQLTHMASVAIDNVRLYREAQEQIAETKRAQEALERSKESMQLAQQHVGIGVWEWDLEIGSLEWSDDIRRMHGFQPDQFDGKYETWMESIHPEDRQQVHQAITDALAKNGEYRVEYRVVFADKSEHWLEARGRTMMMAGTPVRILGVAMDVTSRKMSEEALRRSEKLAATGRLAASIAHEINNPLAAVTNALYILRTSPQLPAMALNYVKTAEAELARVVHITRQTLAFYREVASPVSTSVQQLLDEVLSAYSSKIEGTRITLEKRYADVGPLSAFPGELRQVFSNLVLNAIEAVANSGKVSIHVKHVHDGDGQEGVCVSVADDGPGIAPEHMNRIFEPFFTTKESKGTGLGLWVSQGIVHKHKGSIKVRSSISPVYHGTCFMVFLPFVQTQQKIADAESIVPQSRRTAAGTGDDLSAA